MSADNYIGIWKCKDGKYRGWDLSASDTMDVRKLPKWKPSFVAKNTEDAVCMAQKEWTEYGYHFMNLIEREE